MANVELNPIARSFKGRVGNLVVYKVKDKTYVRNYVVPRNPDTEKQRENRFLFKDAVKAWQALSIEEKTTYNSLAIRRGRGRGYNLFLSLYMKGETGNFGNHADTQCIAHIQKALSRPLSGLNKAIPSVATPLPLLYSICSPSFSADT